MFFSSAPRFVAKRFQLHALCSRKNGGVVRAPKVVLHKLQVFVELLYGKVYGAEFVEQSKHPLYTHQSIRNREVGKGIRGKSYRSISNREVGDGD
jgi:hypothetical protein